MLAASAAAAPKRLPRLTIGEQVHQRVPEGTRILRRKQPRRAVPGDLGEAADGAQYERRPKASAV